MTRSFRSGLAIVAALTFSIPLAASDETANDRLFQSIEKGDLRAVHKALRDGADVNARDKTGAPALMVAALYGNATLLNLLLEKGADPNGTNTAGATALIWSAGDLAKTRALIAKGADVNVRATSGRTPLMVAASNPGNIATVKLLLAKGANVKALTPARGGAVLAAGEVGDEVILRSLLAAGGDANEKNAIGITPLIAAAQFGRTEPILALLDAGARVNDQSGRRPLAKVGLQELGEQTPLLIASYTGNPELVKLLLDRGANVHARDMRGMTPLMMAVASEHQDKETIRRLLARGADPLVKASDGQSVADWAQKFGSAEVAKLIAPDGTVSPVSAPASTVKLVYAPERALRPAVEQTIDLLLKSSKEYFSKSGCVGCHHQMLAGMAVGAAKERGLTVNQELAQGQLKTTLAVRAPDREFLLQGYTRGGAPLAESAVLVSWAAQHHPADRLTAAIVHAVAAMQSADGAWYTHTMRPPMEYSAFTETAFAIRAIQLYGPEGRKDEYNKRIQRAREWLVTNKGKRNEERTMRLLGLAWSGASSSAIAEAGKEILAAQRTDGGWAQRSGLESDAYATGQALYALAVGTDLPVTDIAYRNGLAFLRKTQVQDGSWYVRSRSVKFQPYFDSAFPHEHDQWISAAGSAWAAMAMTLAIEPSKIAAR